MRPWLPWAQPPRRPSARSRRLSSSEISLTPVCDTLTCMTAMDRAGRSALDIRRSRHGRLAVASYWVARPSAVPGKWLHHHGAGYVYRFMHFLQPTRRSFLAYGMYCRRARGTESAHPNTTIQQVLESALYGSDVVHQGACLYRDRHQAKDGLVVESEVKRAHERYCAQSSSAP